MGTVTGPVSSTDTAVALWSGTSGTVIQDSLILVDVLGNITNINSLSSDGGNFSSDGSGNVSLVSLTGSPTTTTQSPGDNSAKIATTAYADTGLAGKISSTLTSGHLLIGNGSNIATDTAVTGDITITNTGVTSIGAARVTAAMLQSNLIIESVGITIDGNFYPPSTGSKGYITVPYSGTIANWYLAANAAGSCVIDVKRSGTSIIGAGNKPTLTSAQTGNAAVSGWTSTSITAGDILEFNLNSISTITRVNLVLKVNRS